MSTQRPTSVALVGEDPLALAALSPALGRFGPAITAAPSRALGADIDVVVWDLGLEPRAALDRHRAIFAEGGRAVIALVPSEAEAPALLAAGARGVLDRAVAAPELEAAIAAVAEGLVVLDRDAAEVLGRARTDEAPPTLTQREREVLERMAEGLSNRAIAEALGVTEHTAKFHVNAILTKLDAATRTEAVVRAARLGLLLL